MKDFPWHKFWLMLAIGSFIFGSPILVIFFGFATWYCWPTR